MRYFWEIDSKIHPLLSILTAVSRDVILRMSAKIILRLEPGQELSRQNLASLLSENLQDRLNEKTIDKVVRNISSSWAQAGHLQGRIRKIRHQIETTPVFVNFCTNFGLFCRLSGRVTI